MNKVSILLIFFTSCSIFSMERQDPISKKRKDGETEPINKKQKPADLFDETIGKVLDKEPLVPIERKNHYKQKLQGFDAFGYLTYLRDDHISLENFNEFNEKSAELFETWINDPDLKFFDTKQKKGILTHYLNSACRDGQPDLIPILLQHGAKKNSSLFDTLMQGYEGQLRSLAHLQTAAAQPPLVNSFSISPSQTRTIFQNMKNNPSIKIQDFLLPIYLKGMRHLIDAGIDPNVNREFADKEAYDIPEEFHLNPRYHEWILPLCVAVNSLVPEFVALLLQAGANPHAESIEMTPYKTLQDLKTRKKDCKALEKIEDLFLLSCSKKRALE